MGDCLGWVCLVFFLFLRYILFWTNSHKVGKMRRHRKPHFTGYFAMVSSGFFLSSGALTSQGNRNILEYVSYRDSTTVGEEGAKEEILNWKYPEDNCFILEGGCFFLILNKYNYNSH